MLLISCSLFLPLVRFPNILPSSMSLNSTSWRRTWPSHLRFHCLIMLTIQRCSITLLRTSELLTFAAQLIFFILLHNHISNVSILLMSVFDTVQVSAAYKDTLHTRHLIIRFLKSRLILSVGIFFLSTNFALVNPNLLLLFTYNIEIITFQQHMYKSWSISIHIHIFVYKTLTKHNEITWKSRPETGTKKLEYKS